MALTLTQAGKFTAIIVGVLTVLSIGFGGLAWGITQTIDITKDYTTIKLTVSEHTETLKRIESTLQQIRAEVVTAPLIGKVSP